MENIMDIKELKKLINEVKKERKVVKEATEVTGAGRPSAIARQKAGILTPGQQTIKSEEDLLVQDMKSNASELLSTLPNLDANTKKFLTNIQSSNTAEEIYNLALTSKNFSIPNPPKAALDLWSALADIERKHSGHSLSPSVSDPELEKAIQKLPTRGKQRWLSKPEEETAKISMANAPTVAKSRPSVEPISPEEKTKTAVFSSLYKENKNIQKESKIKIRIK
jgi:folylpolyglutamate synthase/dihydropteroate synthase